MPDLPLIGGGKLTALAHNTAGSTGTSVSCSASSKGSWVELVAATAEATCWLFVDISTPSIQTTYLVDIGIGGAGSETVIVANLMFQQSGSANQMVGVRYAFPLFVPAGTRIAARGQHATTGSRTLTISGHVLAPGALGPVPGGIVETLGANTGTTRGTSIDPGGSANTKGAWTQIAAATTYRYGYIVLAVGNNVNTVSANQNWLVDLAVGAASSEQVIVENIHFHGSQNVDMPMPGTIGVPLVVPLGSRVAARAQFTGTTSPERLLDVIVYGVG